MNYRLATPRSRPERYCFDCLRRHLLEHPTMRADLRRLSGSACVARWWKPAMEAVKSPAAALSSEPSGEL